MLCNIPWASFLLWYGSVLVIGVIVGYSIKALQRDKEREALVDALCKATCCGDCCD